MAFDKELTSDPLDILRNALGVIDEGTPQGSAVTKGRLMAMGQMKPQQIKPEVGNPQAYADKRMGESQ